MEEHKSMEDYISEQMQNGYIDSNGTPLKCHKCECESMDQKITDRMESIICEYKMICTNCSAEVGYWSYGNWQL